MYHRMAHESQPNPLLPGYSFNAYLVAGLTPILAEGPLDFFIDRPDGMKGYIINLTMKGQGQVFDGDETFFCNPGDLLLFPPKSKHFLWSIAEQRLLVSPLGLFSSARLLGRLAGMAYQKQRHWSHEPAE